MKLSNTAVIVATLSVLMSATMATNAAATCDPSPKACPRHLAPVCATFVKTFGNRCTMESELCRLARDGFHLVEAGDDGVECCSDVQPLMYWPTCATDGKTYDNLWHMRNTACKNRDYLVEAPSSTCPDFPNGWNVPATGV